MKYRCNSDILILSIFPHIISIYFTTNNILYTSIIISSSVSSYFWHKHCEPKNTLLFIDYTFAGVLSLYEVNNTYMNNYDYFYTSILLNVLVLTFNKIVYILSIYEYINYKPWHSYYHILSSLKTIFIAYICNF
jgi:hypothetical protein